MTKTKEKQKKNEQEVWLVPFDTTSLDKAGRPTEYKSEYIDKVKEYLLKNEDEEVEFVKQRNDKKGYEMVDSKLKVKLPTIEGFSRFIGVSKQAVYRWEKDNKGFRNALDDIRIEQKERLLNNGLSGTYNPTIAKLVLSSNHGMSERKEDNEGKKPPEQHIHFHKHEEQVTKVITKAEDELEKTLRDVEYEEK